ncbi:MAG: DEAD/DEAH box helicase family protein [Myxococcales bacterium]|nr:DEAD/DEAH box helicase family protein [Myxococcales bacterium]
MLTWDHGTWVVEPADPAIAERLPCVMWDPRTRCHRAPAWRYGELSALLGCAGVDTSAEPRPGPELRSYQQRALDAWVDAGRRGVVVLPTGGGKTRTAVAAITRSGLSALCVVPTRVLIEPWRRALLDGGVPSVGQLADGVKDVQRVTVATSAAARIHGPRLGARFALLVVDEAHHHAGRDETLELYAAPYRLGLTATPPEDPDRVDRLAQLVGHVVARVTVDELAGTWLAPYELVRRGVDLPPEEARAYAADVATFRAAYRSWWASAPERSWSSFVRDAGRTAQGREAMAAWRRSRQRVAWFTTKDDVLAELLAERARDRVLVFTRDNAVAYAIARRHLIAPLTCDIGRAERDAVLARFASGEIRALVSARVLNEGVDVPAAQVAVLTGGSQGGREYIQRIGRVLRPHEGKKALVVELVARGTHEVDQVERHRRKLAAG